jgi:hypothetical protein
MFYFAWVADGNTVFGPAHHVEDEKVFAFELTHGEGEFAALRIDVINPKVGLLADGRKQWMWLSWLRPDDEVVPLFHGRLVGVPSDLYKEKVRLQFLARPADYEAQKAALAETLKVLPYYDPVWVNPDEFENPDVVLEGRTQMWHIGRTDKLVTVSDILVGEAGTIVFNGDDMIYDDLAVNFGAMPLRKVRVNAQVQWNQYHKGTVDISSRIVQAFQLVSGEGPHPAGQISSYTGEGLEATWPIQGTVIAGGWSVGPSFVQLLSGVGVTPTYVEVDINPLLAIGDPPQSVLDDQAMWEANNPPIENPDFETSPLANWQREQEAAAVAEPIIAARFYLWVFAPTMHLEYEASRVRVENLTFELQSDIQAMVSEPDDAAYIDITLASGNISLELDEGGLMPLRDLRHRSFFNRPRGKQSLEHLICLARAKLLASARCVSVSFGTTFELGTQLSCRHDAQVIDDRLPNGQAGGKVVSYTLSCNGQTGALSANVSIACSIGRGAELPALEEGTASWSDGYADGYQFLEGASIMPVPGEVTYTDFFVPVVDDGVNFFDMTADTVVKSLVVNNGPLAQEEMLEDDDWPTPEDAAAALNDIHTEVELELQSVVGGPFETNFTVEVSDLMVTQTINLE